MRPKLGPSEEKNVKLERQHSEQNMRKPQNHTEKLKLEREKKRKEKQALESAKLLEIEAKI